MDNKELKPCPFCKGKAWNTRPPQDAAVREVDHKELLIEMFSHGYLLEQEYAGQTIISCKYCDEQGDSPEEIQHEPDCTYIKVEQALSTEQPDNRCPRCGEDKGHAPEYCNICSLTAPPEELGYTPFVTQESERIAELEARNKVLSEAISNIAPWLPLSCDDPQERVDACQEIYRLSIEIGLAENGE
jgi:hypothetical protein